MTGSPYLTDEHEAFRQSVRTFLRKEVTPYAPDWERDGTMPRSAWLAFAAEGLLGLNHPRSVGGAEKDIFHSVVFLEELGRMGFGGVRFAVALHAYMATSYLSTGGSADLRERYLRPAVAGERIAALAITEPQAGSDLSLLAATVRDDGDDLVIDGEKRFIVNGLFADFFVTAIRTGASATGQGDLSLCVVDGDSPGVRVVPNDCVSWRASGMADVTFTGVRVPKANLIGRRNSGFMQIMKNMQLERLAAGITAVGDAAERLEATWRFLREREMFGSTLSAKQAVRHQMADLLTEVTATRQLAYHAAWSYARDPLSINECSMIKLKATELARTVAEHCQRLHGAEGFRAQSPFVRRVQDAQAATVAAGASEVMRDIVARSGFEELR
ncbi:acyl-CoA dehydrogenase [Microtetraspora sp. NBRC 13810]|uniref:acyl-CoA dehydrogenase family protein n=1 Tax=Microtetraspora sp. NBRC 13810 TaxID=3030990 RepID=UPI0024A175CE|nr:acyl-CoA dehydrogenase family protein [Microtetraspora sp. NBRC 13810]GLW09717.1 acyl-CoA dehydrogenase [Microtetraspora sp. NBRC 13810]